MASVASSGTPPHPGLEQFQGDYVSGDDESWAFISPQGLAPSSSGSVDFFSSPETGSLRSYGIVGRRAGSHVQPSPPAPSPLFLDADSSSPQGFAMHMSAADHAAAYVGQGQQQQQQQQQRHHAGSFSSGFGDQGSFPDQAPFLDPLAFADQMMAFPPSTGPADSQLSADGLFSGRLFRANEFGVEDPDIQDFTSFLEALNTYSPQNLPGAGIDLPISAVTQSPSMPLDISRALRQQSETSVAPWSPSAMTHNSGGSGNLVFRMEEFGGPHSAHTPVTPTPTSASTSSPSARLSASPVSPVVKQEPGLKSSPPASSSAMAIRKVKNARVEKRKSPMDLSASAASSLGSNGSGGSASTGELALKFITISSESAAASGGKGNMFEGYDRMTQRGRKGPLAKATKESARIVRQKGACFSCHARKVKCEATRPCKNCLRSTAHLHGTVPPLMCWQFQDFIPILFPTMLRAHFARDQMAAFVSENVQDFLVDGAERPCTVELTSGSRFKSTLTIPAKAFMPKQPEILAHWRQELQPNAGVSLTCGVAAPIGLDVHTSASQRDNLRKRAREYVANIVREPAFAEETTASIRSTRLPRQVLLIVQRYALQSQSEIVERALTIYANHYVLTRHLTFTAKGLADLMTKRLASQNHAQQTPRLLNRQFKALLDELNQREMTLMFEAFSKSLKPKMRKEWAPCMAAFLVLTLFMEELEVALDVFGVSQNQIDRERSRPGDPQFSRKNTLAMNKEVEHMPFKQFAYQFHQIYQTHSTDASTKPFNPLVDDSLLDAQYLDPAAMEMVQSLRLLMWDADSASELDFLSGQAAMFLDSPDAYAYPMDPANIYSGRLMAKFILSFSNLQYLLDP